MKIIPLVKSLLPHAVWSIVAVACFVLGQNRAQSVQVFSREESKQPQILRALAITEGGRETASMDKQFVDATPSGSLAGLSARELTPDRMRSLMSSAFLVDDPLQRKRQILELIANLTPQTIDAALEAFESAPDKERVDGEFRDFLFAWGQLDGAAAIAYASDEGAAMRDRYGAFSAIRGWADRDISGAKAFVDELKSGDQKQWMHYGVFRTMLGKDLDNAIAYAQNNERSRARGREIDMLASEIFKQRGANGLKNWVDSIDENGENEMGSYKRAAMERLVTSVGKENPQLADQFLREALEKGSQVVDGGLMRETARVLHGNAPDEMMRYIASLPASRETSVAIRDTVERYAERDPNAVASFLSEVVGDPAYEQSISLFATKIVNDDPVSAISWALEIQNERRQFETVRKVLRSWQKLQPDEARAWMDARGINI